MYSTFVGKPIFGPAVSVRHSTGTSQPVRLSANRSSRRKNRFGFLSKVLSSGSQVKSASVYGLLVLFTVGLISHIFLINSSAAKGYEMRKIQNNIQAQTDIQHSLDIKTAELSSLGSIDEAAQVSRLVGIKNEEFIASSTVTALKTTK